MNRRAKFSSIQLLMDFETEEQCSLILITEYNAPSLQLTKIPFTHPLTLTRSTRHLAQAQVFLQQCLDTMLLHEPV